MSSRREDTSAMPPQSQPPTRKRSPLLVTLLFIGLLAGVCCGLYWSRSTAGSLSFPATLLSHLQPPAEDRFIFSPTPDFPSASPDLLASRLPAVYFFYDLPRLNVSAPPKITWSRDGHSLGSVPPSSITTGLAGPQTATVVLRPPDGALKPGIYEVELAFPTVHLAASFVAADDAAAIMAQPTPRDAELKISEAATASAIDRTGRPVGARTSFSGAERIYLAFHFTQAEPSSAVIIHWYAGGIELTEARREVVLPSSEGWAHGWLQALPGSPLPPHEYRATVSLSADSKEIAAVQFIVTAARTSPTGSPPPQPTAVPSR